jgi:hypothetical protein
LDAIGWACSQAIASALSNSDVETQVNADAWQTSFPVSKLGSMAVETPHRTTPCDADAVPVTTAFPSDDDEGAAALLKRSAPAASSRHR